MTKLFLVLTIFLAFSTKAQVIESTGKVVDSIDTPIGYANVLAIEPESGSIKAFAITGPDGRFKFSLNHQGDILIKVSFIGYQTFEKRMLASKENLQGIIIELEPSVQMLDEVEVVHEMPVTISGDTLIYKTDVFTDGSERKLADVLEKLPGVEIDDNGEVKVQGKKVSKVMVEGKDFFDGDTKLATKNLPANAVDKVQVLRNFNEVQAMKGLDGAENLALNIQLKEDKKRLFFGDLTAGGGPNERYQGHSNLFYYSPETSLNLIADANNIGAESFTLRDYLRFSGGLSNLASRSGSNVRLNGNELGIPLAGRENAAAMDSKMAAVNFTVSPSKTWSHSGFFIGSQTDNTFGSISQKTYLNEAISQDEILTRTQQSFSRSGLGKYELVFSPRPEHYLKYSAFGKMSLQESLLDLHSDFGEFTNSIDQVEQQLPYSLEQRLEYYHTRGANNVFSLEANYSLQQDDPTLELVSSANPFPEFLPLEASESYQLNQFQQINSNNLTVNGNYYRILNRTNHLNFNLGYQQLNQSLRSGLSQEDRLLARNAEGFRFFNDANFSLYDSYAGLSMKSKVGPIVWSPSLFIHHYRTRQLHFDHADQRSVSVVLPSLKAKWKISSAQALSFNYRSTAEFMDVRKRIQGVLLTDYNGLFRGNANLTQGLYHNLGLNYRLFNMVDGLTFYANTLYQIKQNDISPTSLFSGPARINSVTNIDPINDLLRASVHADQKFNTFKISGGADLTRTKTHTLINDSENVNHSIMQDYRANIQTTFFEILHLNAGYSHQFNTYRSSRAVNTFQNLTPRGGLKLKLWHHLHFETDYEYNLYRNQQNNTNSAFQIWDANLRYYQEGSPWEVRLSGYNLLNTQEVRRDTFNENWISTYAFRIQPRYFLLSLTYDI